jgi:hypothetical protein
MADSVEDAFGRYVRDPAPAIYLELRSAVAASSQYDPYSSEFDEINELLEAARYSEALAIIHKDMRKYLLTPRAHYLAAFTYSKLGDEKYEHMEAFLASLMLDGLLGTGDGSEERPYLVTQVTDEYDILRHLGKTPSSQSLIDKEDGRHFDLVRCTDGTSLWFDIEMQFERMALRSPLPSDAPTTRPTNRWQFWKRR